MPSSSQVGRFFFPQALRLKKAWEFDLVFRTGRRLYGPLVRLLYVRAPDGHTRWGLAVGKRLTKAHGRVRGRRVLREAIRRLQPWVAQGWWFAASLSNDGLNSSAPDIYIGLRALLDSRKMLTHEPPAVAFWSD